MRPIPVCVCALALAIAAHASAQSATDSTWRDHRRAASAALNAGDTAGYRNHSIALQHQVGTTPRIAAGLAEASFALHDTTSGSRWSGILAAMGIGFDTALVAPLLKANTVAQLVQRDAAARRTVDHSTPAWTLNDVDMIAEDLVYDGTRHRTLVSSVRRGTIVAIDQHGHTTTFVPPSAGVWGIFALGIDPHRNTLWATTAAFPGTAGYTSADSGKSALLEYNLISGALRRRIVPPDSGAHALGDMTVAPDGSVYLSDGVGGGVYVLDPHSAALRILLPAGTLSSPQTPALSADGKRLFVADWTFGIAVIELGTGAWHWLRHGDSLALTGIDGLYRAGRDLITVQNGVEPNRIMRLTLDASDRIVRAAPIARGGNAIELTHAMMRDGWIYFIARSGWDRYAADGTMKPAAEGGGPEIRMVRVPSH